MGKGDTATDTLMDGPITWGMGDIVSVLHVLGKGDIVSLSHGIQVMLSLWHIG